MNGRVYDPAVGRFLSVDPVFQFPENTQSLNPYTYVLNSPLSFTDPTGFVGASASDVTDDERSSGGEGAAQNAEKDGSADGGGTTSAKYKESANTRRGGTTIYYGRADTNSDERQTGRQTNGMALSEQDRGEFANTERVRPDRIGAPATRASQVAVAVADAAALDTAMEQAVEIDPATAIADCGSCINDAALANSFFRGEIDAVQMRDVQRARAAGAAAGLAIVVTGVAGAEIVGIIAIRGTATAASAEASGTISPAICTQLEGQLLRDGPRSIHRALRSAQRTLAGHVEKLPTLKYKSQVETTISNVRNQIETLKQFIRDKGL
jgi:hypothetical protein